MREITQPVTHCRSGGSSTKEVLLENGLQWRQKPTRIRESWGMSIVAVRKALPN